MTENSELSLTGYINGCVIALDAFKRCLRTQQWDRLAGKSAAINQQMQGLAARLAEEKADDKNISRIRMLEVDVRRMKRQLALQMKAVKEDIDTVDKGIRKLERSAELLKVE